MVEHIVHIDGVTGSSPVATTREPNQKWFGSFHISTISRATSKMKRMRCGKHSFKSVTSEAIELGFGLGYTKIRTIRFRD